MPAFHTVYLSVNENKKSAASAFSLRAYEENNGLHLLKSIDLNQNCNKALCESTKQNLPLHFSGNKVIMTSYDYSLI